MTRYEKIIAEAEAKKEDKAFYYAALCGILKSELSHLCIELEGLTLFQNELDKVLHNER